MKTYIKIGTFALLLSVLSSSCKKGWLDVAASNEIEAEDQFKSPSGFKDALMGVYIAMTDPTLYAKDMTWNLVDLLSQQYATLGGSPYLDLQAFDYESITGRPLLDGIWNKQYNAIANINNALKYIDSDQQVLSTIDYRIIKGELLGLRAFLHFDLIRMYGHGDYANRPDLASRNTIPYVTSYDKEITPQRSYQETFTLLEADIQAALELLQEDPVYPGEGRGEGYYADVNRNGFYNDRSERMNYYAVKALQARVLAWQGGSDKMNQAAAAAEEVIEHSFAHLITGNTDVSRDRTLPDEHLFALQIEGFADIVNPSLTSSVGINYGLFIPATTSEAIYETSNPNIGLVDIRYNTLLTSESRGMVSNKLRQEISTSTFFDLMPLIKLPEMYYIAAEHYITSNPSKATDLLNQVRESRRISEAIPYGLSAEQLTEELFKEYRKEYVSEGQLFFYYKRIGLEHIPGLSVDFKADDQVYVIPYPDSEVEFGNRVQ